MAAGTLLITGAIATAALLICSAFFSSAEIALFSLPESWRETVGSDPRASGLAELLTDPHRLLVTILVGNNIVNIAIASIVTVLVGEFLPPGPAIAVTTLITSVLILVAGEIVPKAYGLANAQGWSLRVARPIRLVERILGPVISVFDWVTRRLNALLPVDRSIERVYTD
jgi:Mg2+/Co2+ transporter CorB